MSLTLNRFLLARSTLVRALGRGKNAHPGSDCARERLYARGLSCNNQVEREAIQIQGTIYLLMDDHLLYVTGNVFGNAC